MFGCHVEMNYSKRRYQQAIDDCKYSAQYFNAVAICAFTKGKIICPKLFSKCFTLKKSNLNTTLWAIYKSQFQVILPEDLKKRRPQQLGRMAQVEEQVYTKDRPPPIEGQLISVQAHIEDLEVKYILNLQGNNI